MAQSELKHPGAVLLVGANPAVQLFDDDGACTAYASCWRVDWSIHGAGAAIVLWQPTGVSVHAPDEHLGMWLAEAFVRHFPELNGQTWSRPRHHSTSVQVDVDLHGGMVARAGTVSVRTSDVLDVRAFRTDEFRLDGVDHDLSLVLAPCTDGSIDIDGHPVPGAIRRSGTAERPTSSAFVTDAEVWRTVG